jgi:nitroimidazol reductase NimA-like FMN-containing flavoprotein (pyridoxamine 5'-phosphate oxidase superfamily)
VPDDKAVAQPPVLSAIVELDRAECLEIIRRQRMCVISVVDGDEPYAVPVYYGFDGETLYLGVAEGRKTRALDRNPRVHIVIAEPGGGDSWRSVAIAGRATTLSDPVERARGIDALIEHNRRPERGATGASAGRRRSGGRILRIDEAIITGRARR